MLPSGTRLALLDRFGLFGVRLAASLLRRGVDDSATLAAELARRSGLDELREILEQRFLARRDVFQARSALLAVERLLARARAVPTAEADPRPSPVPRPPAPQALAALTEHVERVRTGAHAIVELDALTRLRRRPLDLPGRGAGPTDEALRLLGDRGPATTARLGVAEETGAGEQRAVALATLGRWRGHAENPFAAPDTVETAQVVIRSLEGVLAELPRPVAVG